MKIYRAYKTELDLNDAQTSKINQGFGVSRFAYNWGLEDRGFLWDTLKKTTNAIEQTRELNRLKKIKFPWMYEVSKCIPQEALRDLDKAFLGFFRNIRKGIKDGYPKFKSKGDGQQSFRLAGSIRVGPSSIQLPRLGSLRVKEDNYLPRDKKILSATVSRHAGKYFISVATEEEFEIPQDLNDRVLGIDLGIKNLAITSDGVYFENPVAYRRFLKKIKRLQRWNNRKEKGKNNRKEAKLKLQKLHAKIVNIRKDTIHKMTTKLVRTKPTTIVIEDLSPKNMMANHCLAGSLADASFGEIKRQLVYKCAWSGINLVLADRFYPSSKTCSSCGHVKRDLKLSDRTYSCEACGLSIDRDLNAAINLKNYPKISTASSAGINALGEGKLQTVKSPWPSMSREHSREVALQLPASL